MANPPSEASVGCAEVTFRPFRQESDYARMLAIVLASAQADRDDWAPTLDEIRAWCAPAVRFEPKKQLVFALAPAQGASVLEVGVSRVSWYTGLGGARIYPQTSFLLPEWRRSGVWPALVREAERSIRELAAGHPSLPGRSLQGWATESQTQWIDALTAEGYEAVRHYRNMVRPLADVPEVESRPLPHGLEIRPVVADHMRRIWEAEAEVNRELFEYVAEQWTDDKYPGWLADASHTPRLWQVAWDGDEVAGMVLPRVDEADPGREKKRGYTEHVFVRCPWRGRGLAKGLLVRSLWALKEEGMDEAELGVDSENSSGAFGFYQRMGYVTERTDIWFRKPLDAGDVGPRAA